MWRRGSAETLMYFDVLRAYPRAAGVYMKTELEKMLAGELYDAGDPNYAACAAKPSIDAPVQCDNGRGARPAHRDLQELFASVGSASLSRPSIATTAATYMSARIST